jgi:hypothetical protein
MLVYKKQNIFGILLPFYALAILSKDSKKPPSPLPPWTRAKLCLYFLIPTHIWASMMMMEERLGAE